MAAMRPKLIEFLIELLHHVENEHVSCPCPLCTDNLIYWIDTDLPRPQRRFVIDYQDARDRSRERQSQFLFERYHRYVSDPSRDTKTDPKQKFKANLNKACKDGREFLDDHTRSKKAYIEKLSGGKMPIFRFISEGVPLLEMMWRKLDQYPVYPALFDFDTSPAVLSSPEEFKELPAWREQPVSETQLNTPHHNTSNFDYSQFELADLFDPAVDGGGQFAGPMHGAALYNPSVYIPLSEQAIIPPGSAPACSTSFPQINPALPITCSAVERSVHVPISSDGEMMKMRDGLEFMSIHNDVEMDESRVDSSGQISSKRDLEAYFKNEFERFRSQYETVPIGNTAHNLKDLHKLGQDYRNGRIDLSHILSTRVDVYTCVSNEPTTYEQRNSNENREIGFRIISHPQYWEMYMEKVSLFGPPELHNVCIQSALYDIAPDKYSIRSLFEALHLQSLCFVWRAYRVTQLPAGCDPVVAEMLQRISYKLYCFNLVRTARKPGENGKAYKLKMCIDTPLGGCRELQYGTPTEVFDFGALFARMYASSYSTRDNSSRAFIGVGKKNIAKDEKLQLRFVLTNTFLERMEVLCEKEQSKSHISADTASSASTAL